MRVYVYMYVHEDMRVRMDVYVFVYLFSLGWFNFLGPKDFIRKCREALECPYVSENIHYWIDLIFGYKQQGEEAWKANNGNHYAFLLWEVKVKLK